MSRMTRGEQIAKENTIRENADGSFSVPSQRVAEIEYRVVLVSAKYQCNCPDFVYRKVEACKHIFATKLWVAAQVEIKQAPKPKVFSDDSVQCDKCGSIRVIKYGVRGNKQAYRCKDCGHKFTPSLIGKSRYTPETVSLCLDLYFSGTSLAKTARILNNQYDMKLTKVTIYRWIQRFIPKISEYVNTFSPQLSDTWHADELFVKMKEGIDYSTSDKRDFSSIAFVWNIMDRKTRFLLASKLSEKRDRWGCNLAFNAARKVAKDSLPSFVTSDSAGAYGGIQTCTAKGWEVKHIKNVGINKVHLPHPNNNRIERLNGTLRERVKVQRGWKSMKTQIPEGMRIHYNFVKPHQELEGMTPAQRAGITSLNGSKNKWLTLLESALDNQSETTARFSGKNR